MRAGIFAHGHHQNETAELPELETLNVLMMISSNGPSLEKEDAVRALIEKVINHWIATSKRNVARSLGKAGRPTKQNRPAVRSPAGSGTSGQRQIERDGPLDDNDDDESQSDEEAAADEPMVESKGDGGEDNKEDATANNAPEQTRQAVGPFNIPADYELITLLGGSETQQVGGEPAKAVVVGGGWRR